MTTHLILTEQLAPSSSRYCEFEDTLTRLAGGFYVNPNGFGAWLGMFEPFRLYIVTCESVHTQAILDAAHQMGQDNGQECVTVISFDSQARFV